MAFMVGTTTVVSGSGDFYGIPCITGKGKFYQEITAPVISGTGGFLLPHSP